MLIKHVCMFTYVCTLEDFAIIEEHEQNKFGVDLKDGPPQSHTLFHGHDLQTMLVFCTWVCVHTHVCMYLFAMALETFLRYKLTFESGSCWLAHSMEGNVLLHALLLFLNSEPCKCIIYSKTK